MNNRKLTRGRKRQNVLSAPSKTLIGTYENKHGDVKNRYRKNTDAKVVRVIKHLTTR